MLFCWNLHPIHGLLTIDYQSRSIEVRAFASQLGGFGLESLSDTSKVDVGKRSFITNLKIRLTINKVNIFISVFLYGDNSDYLTPPYRHNPINSSTLISK